MGVFTDNIVVEIYPGTKRPYSVFREFEFHSGKPDSGLFVRCEKGFRFDGTSIPWVLRWLISRNDLSLLQCAAGHDKAFRTGTLIMRINGTEVQVPVHRDVANALMAEMMIAKGVKKWKRSMINTGLAIGSGPAWRRAARERGALRTDTTKH